jgi:creatinine amidohydrolase
MLWEEINWMEFEKLVPDEYDTAILPTGTVEAHGVSPLGTDNLIPMEICRRIAEDLKAIIAPPVNYGITSSLLGYPTSH